MKQMVLFVGLVFLFLLVWLGQFYLSKRNIII